MKRQGRLWVMILMVGTFFVVELVVGYTTGSIALVADSFHMLSDLMALLIAVYAIRVAKRTHATKSNSFGLQRAELLGALVNSVFLLALCFTLLIESIQRFISIEEVEDPKLVLIVGGVGLGINLIAMTLFADVGHGHSHSHGGGGSHGHSSSSSSSPSPSSSPSEKPKPTSHAHSHSQQGHSHDHGHSHHTSLEDHALPQSSHIELEIGQTYKVKEASSSQKSTTLSVEEGDEVVIIGHIKRNTYLVRSKGEEGRLNAKYLDVPSKVQEEVVIDIDTDIPINKVNQNNGQNMRAVFLHVLGDALGSIGVIISALVIWLVEGSWKYYLDPTISILITMLIVFSTVPLMRNTSSILLQGVPNFDFESLRKALLSIQGVQGIHDLHVWKLADDKLVGSAHLRVEKKQSAAACSKAKTVFHSFDVHSSTIQVEILKKTTSRSSSLLSLETEDEKTCLLTCPEEKCLPKSCCPPEKKLT